MILAQHLLWTRDKAGARKKALTKSFLIVPLKLNSLIRGSTDKAEKNSVNEKVPYDSCSALVMDWRLGRCSKESSDQELSNGTIEVKFLNKGKH